MIICENGQHEVNFMKWTRKKKMLFKDAFCDSNCSRIHLQYKLLP